MSLGVCMGVGEMVHGCVCVCIPGIAHVRVCVCVCVRETCVGKK